MNCGKEHSDLMNEGSSTDRIELDADHVLVIQRSEAGLGGQVVVRDRQQPNRGTQLFDLPPQRNAEALVDLAYMSLQAAREG